MLVVPHWERKVLPSGLILLLMPRSSSLTAQLSVAVKYGSNDDSESSSGCAHFLEHMIVGGSQKKIKLHNEIETFGGCSYFETSSECIFAKVDVFPEKLASASKVLSGLLFDPVFEEAKLEIERKVILNEIAEASDDPRDKVGETLIKSLFRRHPVRNPISGTKKTVGQMALSDLERSHKKYFVTNNLIVILTGRFSDEDVHAVLDDFQDHKSIETIVRKNSPSETRSPEKEKKLQRQGINQAYLSIGLRTAPTNDPDVPTLDLIDAILGTGESSRLFIELREKNALTYDFDSINVSGLDFGFLAVNCAVKAASLERTRAIILKELEKLKTTPVSPSELEKSKKLLIANVYRAIDDSHELPRLLADSEIHYGNENALREYLAKIESLAPEKILQTASKYFRDENYSTTLMIPKK